MSDADKFLSVFRWAIEHGTAGTRPAVSALRGVEVRDLPGPADEQDARRDPPAPMSEADKKFLEAAIKSITIDEVEQVRSLARTISRAAGVPIQPLMEIGARIGKDGTVLPKATPMAATQHGASESKSADAASRRQQAEIDEEESDARTKLTTEIAVAADAARLADALDQLNLYCSSSDNSTILGAMGGMVPLVRLTAHPAPRVAAGASEALSTVVQNHPVAQALALRSGALLALLRRLDASLRALADGADADALHASALHADADRVSGEVDLEAESKVATKTVLALSSLLGGYAPAQDMALQMTSLGTMASQDSRTAAEDRDPDYGPTAAGAGAGAVNSEEQNSSEDDECATGPPQVSAPSDDGTSTALILSPVASGADGEPEPEPGAGAFLQRARARAGDASQVEGAHGSSSGQGQGTPGGDGDRKGEGEREGGPDGKAGEPVPEKAWLGEAPRNPPLLLLLLQAMLLRNQGAAPDGGRLRSKASRCLLRLLDGPRGLAMCAAQVGPGPREQEASMDLEAQGAEAGVVVAWPLLGGLAACAADAVPGARGDDVRKPLWEAGGVPLQTAENAVRCIGSVLRTAAESLVRERGGSGAAASGAGEVSAADVIDGVREGLSARVAELARASAGDGGRGSLAQAIVACQAAASHVAAAPSDEDKEMMEDLLRESTEAVKVGGLALLKAQTPTNGNAIS